MYLMGDSSALQWVFPLSEKRTASLERKAYIQCATIYSGQKWLVQMWTKWLVPMSSSFRGSTVFLVQYYSLTSARGIFFMGSSARYSLSTYLALMNLSLSSRVEEYIGRTLGFWASHRSRETLFPTWSIRAIISGLREGGRNEDIRILEKEHSSIWMITVT